MKMNYLNFDKIPTTETQKIRLQ